MENFPTEFRISKPFRIGKKYQISHWFFSIFGGHSMTTWTRRGGRWSKKSLFLSTFRVKNVHVEVGGGQKRAKLCPRSHWMPPTLENRLFMFIVYAFESDLFDDFIIFKLLVARQPKSMQRIQTIFSKKNRQITPASNVPL